MHSSRSAQVPARLRTYENFEKLAKTSRKLHETRVSAIVHLYMDVTLDVSQVGLVLVCVMREHFNLWEEIFWAIKECTTP